MGYLLESQSSFYSYSSFVQDFIHRQSWTHWHYFISEMPSLHSIHRAWFQVAGSEDFLNGVWGRESCFHLDLSIFQPSTSTIQSMRQFYIPQQEMCSCTALWMPFLELWLCQILVSGLPSWVHVPTLQSRWFSSLLNVHHFGYGDNCHTVLFCKI